MYNGSSFLNIGSIICQKPCAVAIIKGSEEYPNICGKVRFHQTTCGVLVVAEITGLPKATAQSEYPIFAFHIHSGERCSGNEKDPFSDAMTHYNPCGCPHPYHAGDMPPLFGNNGCAFLAFLSNRFLVKDIIGKTVIIHSSPDDFTTQPVGNAGIKIACGVIRSVMAC